MHTPVLLNEVLEYLNSKPNQNFIDATVGDGGHAKAILEKTAPNGKLIAIDRDLDSVIRAKSNLRRFGNRVLFINDSFGNILKIVKNSGLDQIKGILFDFGMSTSQLENSGKGFSFQKDEVLDMRYDAKIPITAENILNDYSETELFRIFKKLGEEPKSKIIIKAIVNAREKKRIKTTKELVGIIEKVLRRRGKLHPATLVFQALRIEVNQELVEIEKALADLPKVLSSNGRIAFISFHSLEDRLIKNWVKDLSKKNIIKILNKKPLTASAEELKANPKSRSAKLRVIEKI
ncbi:MAG: 16S rRNA (cytosine(1402)-N(4))-methyltransferase RsmH [Candidatus Azambacteria bacterium]|nr:16S rRNA (cytosine(1402)-N(4))-methyltransferase RsmH [Candidatus Azambacteria bacterium]